MLKIILAIFIYVFSTIIGGTFYAIISLFTSPFLRIQTILQCTEKSDEPLGAVQIFKRIIKYEGYRGLWKSYLPPIFIYLVNDPIELILREVMPSIFEDASYSDSERYITWILMNTYRGSVRFVIPLILTYPFGFAETKLANDARLSEYSKTQYKGIKDLFKKTLLNDGILGLFRGIGLDLLGLLGYQFIKWSSLSLMHSFGFSIDSAVSDCLADYFAYSLLYPSIVLRSRIIVRPENHGKIDIWKSFTDIIRNEGVTGLFGGYLFVVIEMIGAFLFFTFFGKFPQQE